LFLNDKEIDLGDISKINVKFVENDNINKQFTNKSNNRKLNSKNLQKYSFREIDNINSLNENPCYLKGYLSKENNIKGSGNFTECYEKLEKVIQDKQQQSSMKKNNKTSVIFRYNFNSYLM
jgi:hypothetical protein